MLRENEEKEEIIKDGESKLSIDIPYLNDTIEIQIINEEQREEDDIWFSQQFAIFEKELSDFKSDNENYDEQRFNKIKDNLQSAKEEYNSELIRLQNSFKIV